MADVNHGIISDPNPPSTAVVPAKIEMSNIMTVKLVRALAHDDHVVQAAQVSVKGENKPGTDMPRLINYLMEAGHGSPFEHSTFTFFAEVPIFVAREWFRHRIASYNEMSGRYTELIPKFFTPSNDRKLQNIGTSARPEFAEGTAFQQQLVYGTDKGVAQNAWDAYQRRLKAGVANEIARTVLPVSIYTQFYFTVNARSLMNFLALRVDSPDALRRTRPQWEIQVAAEKMEESFAELMPITYATFVKNGRVAP
jgi:thymidylate synthase (FAD)